MIIMPIKYHNFISGNMYRNNSNDYNMEQEFKDAIISYCNDKYNATLYDKMYIDAFTKISPYFNQDYSCEACLLLDCFDICGEIYGAIISKIYDTYQLKIVNMRSVFLMPIRSLYDGSSAYINYDKMLKTVCLNYFNRNISFDTLYATITPEKTVLTKNGEEMITFNHFEKDVHNIIHIGEAIQICTPKEIAIINQLIQMLYNVIKCMILQSNNKYELIMI